MSFVYSSRKAIWFCVIVCCLVLPGALPVSAQVCGDANASGGFNLPDWTFLYSYLYLEGVAPDSLADANLDSAGSITANDLTHMTNYLFYFGPLNCSPVEANTPFPGSADVVTFKRTTVAPGNTLWTVEVWLDASASFYNLSLPFSFNCATSPLTLESITLYPAGSTDSRIDNPGSKGLIGLAQIMSPYGPGLQQVADLNFSIQTSAETQLIDFAYTDYAPSNIACLSRINGGTALGFTPVLIEEVTQEICCGGRVGNVLYGGGDEPTIGDVAALIDAIFTSATCDGIIDCLSEADVNQSGGANPTCDDITIGDITQLLDYLFITGSSFGLPDCLSGLPPESDTCNPCGVDLGQPDSLIAEISVAEDGTTATVELYLSNDLQDIIQLSSGFGWNNPKAQLFGFAMSAEADSAFDGWWGYYRNSLDSTNAYQLFQGTGFHFAASSLMSATAGRTLLASYHFTLTGWTDTDSLCIIPDPFVAMRLVDPANAEYVPIWHSSGCAWQPVVDTDHDGILDDGDLSGTAGDNPCVGGATTNCDDNCPTVANADQLDPDNDGVGTICDNCPTTYNPLQTDLGGDGIGDACQGFSPVETGPVDVVSLEAADLDLDAYIDVVFIGDTDPGLFVSWGADADPPIGPAVQIGTVDITDATIVIFHLDGDTLPDIVAATSTTIYSFINNGDRTFTTSSVPNSVGTSRQSEQATTAFGDAPHIAVGFFDADATPDLVVSPDKWFTGDGFGGFTGNAALPIAISSVAAYDFTGDGIDDLAVIEGGALVVYSNDGTGSFTWSSEITLAQSTYDLSSITVGVDVDLDGVGDVIAVTAVDGITEDLSYVTVASGDGAGGLALTDEIIVAGLAVQVSTSDVDRDLIPDLVVSNVSDGTLDIHYNDGTGQFGEPETIEVGTSGDLMFALASADLDRDGQPDFVSGSAIGENLVLSLNNQTDEPVLADELFVTGYDFVDVALTNPNGFVISRSLTTVAGADYYRLLVDDDEFLDVRAYDYNLQPGTYTVVGIPKPGSGDIAWSMGIGIDGSQQAIVAQNYIWPPYGKASTEYGPDNFLFYYEVESSPSMRPWNGIPTDHSLPIFQWKLRTDSDPEGTVYAFQIDDYHDFSSIPLREEASGLTQAEYTVLDPLPRYDVYYWRYLTSHNGGATYPDTSLTFAVNVSDCCLGRVGDANSSGIDEPTIGDVSTMIDALYIAEDWSIVPCLGEADVNQSGGTDPTQDDITIGDISYLIDYLFITGPEIATLPDCL